MFRLLSLLVLALLMFTGVASAQTPATYSDRAKLSADADFQGRITIAALVAAIGVVTEDNTTADHVVRVKLASAVLKDPDFVARRLAQLLAATAPATVTDGKVNTPLTDAQILSTITTRWTALARALTGQTS